MIRKTDANTMFGRLLLAHGIADSARDPDWETSYSLVAGFRRDSGMTTVAALRSLEGPAGKIVSRHRLADLKRALKNALNSMLGYTELASFVGREAQQQFVDHRYFGLIRKGSLGTALIFILGRFGVAFFVATGAFFALFWWIRHPGPGLVVLGTAVAISMGGSLAGQFFARARAPFDPFLMWCALVGWTLAVRWVRNRLHAGNDEGGGPDARPAA